MIPIASDGRIEINTKINDNGVSQGANKISSIMGRVAKSVRGVANANAEAFGPKTQRQLDNLTKTYKRQSESAQKAANAVLKAQEDQEKHATRSNESISKQQHLVEELQSKWAKVEEAQRAAGQLESHQKVINEARSNLEKLVQDEKKLYREVNKAPSREGLNAYRELTAEIENTRQGIKRLEDDSRKLREVMMQAPSGDAVIKLKDQFEEAIGKLERLKNESQVTGEQLQRAADLAASRFERVSSEAQLTADEIERVKNASDDLPKGPAKASRTMNLFTRSTRKANRELQRSNKSAGGLLGTVDKLGKRIARLAVAALVFNVIRRAFVQLRNYMWTVMRTNNQFVNSLASVKGNLLTAFQPIYEAILPALNSLASGLARVTGYIAAFMSALFGKSAAVSQKSAESLYDQAKGLEEVGNAADKAAGKLAAFDEINVLAQDNANTLAGNADVIAPDFDYDLSIFDAFEEKLNSILDVFRDAWANVGDFVVDNWNYALQSTLELAKKIGATFYEVWTDGHGQALLESLLRVLGTVLGIIGDIASAFSKAWDKTGYLVVAGIFEALTSVFELLGSIGQAFREAWSNSLGESIATNILEIISNIFYIISEFAQRLREAWEANGNGVAIWESILGIVDSVLSTISGIFSATLEWVQSLNLEPLVSGFRNVLEAIQPVVDIILDGIGWAYENVLLPFGSWLLELAVPAALGLLATAFEFLGAILEAIKPAVKWIWDNFLKPVAEWTGGLIIDTLGWIGEKFQWLTDLFKENGELITLILQAIGEFASYLWNDMLEPILTIATDFIKNTVDSILDILGGVITFLTGVFTGDWEKAWDGIKDIFSGVWNGIASVFEAVINAIITGLNLFIKALNVISFDIPDWVPVIGGKKFGFNIPEISKISIPKLATGAVIPPNSEFLAILGDQKRGKNLELPESLLDEKFAALAEALQNNGGGEVTVTVNFAGSLSELARILNPEITAEQKRIGTNLVTGGAF